MKTTDMWLENTEKMTQCQLARYQLEGRIFGREDIYLYLYGRAPNSYTKKSRSEKMWDYDRKVRKTLVRN